MDKFGIATPKAEGAVINPDCVPDPDAVHTTYIERPVPTVLLDQIEELINVFLIKNGYSDMDNSRLPGEGRGW